jgi:hypothetical protein
MLVLDGTPLRDLHDPEGFVAGAHQFDSDITSGRHPRAALGASDNELIALVCDGRRTGIDAGLTLAELAELIEGTALRHDLLPDLRSRELAVASVRSIGLMRGARRSSGLAS